MTETGRYISGASLFPPSNPSISLKAGAASSVMMSMSQSSTTGLHGAHCPNQLQLRPTERDVLSTGQNFGRQIPGGQVLSGRWSGFRAHLAAGTSSRRSLASIGWADAACW